MSIVNGAVPPYVVKSVTPDSVRTSTSRTVRPLSVPAGRPSSSIAASAMISGERECSRLSWPPSRFPTAAVAIIVCGHRQLLEMGRFACSAAMPNAASVIPYLASM